MAQLGNTYTGKFKDIPSYLTQNHFYWSYDTKELYSFEPDHTPYLLFNQDNDLRTIHIASTELPVDYTKDDVLNYLNSIGIEKADIETLLVEIVGGDQIGDQIPITWGFIADKPVTFPPSQHVHSYNDLTDLPDLSNIGGRSDEEIEGIIQNFLVDGDGIQIVYDETEGVLRFNVDGDLHQENINIVVNIAREALDTADEDGLVTYLNTLNPPLLIDGTHNLYFNIADENSSSQFDYNLDFNLN
jgi:hypothetical protein